jgi:hypothetical protein
MTLAGTIRLDKLGDNAHRDSTAEGKGTPNYLAGLAVSKDGSRLLVASNKMNSDKGLLVGADLDQDNTVRNLLTVIDTATNEVIDSLDLDNSDCASAVAFSPLGDYFFVALQGNNEISVFDRFEVDRSAGLGGFVSRQTVGRSPRGLACDPVTGRPFVKNDLGRDLTVFELADFYAQGRADFPRQVVATTTLEVLPEPVLRGKQLFHHAGDPRMSGEGYLSCATCHAGTEMTDGLLHDVGTTGTTSGSRLGGPLPGIGTPTLRGLWESGPYFHDGSAKTLAEVFSTTGGTQVQAEGGAISGGGEITTEWTYYNNDETVRGEALAQNWNGGNLTLDGIDGGSGGVGAITVRYSLGYSGGSVRVRVNGTNHTVNVNVTGNVPDWRYVNWQTVRVEDVVLNPGPDNTIQISALSPDWLPIGIDEITVSTAAKLTAAEPHRRASRLNATEKSQLETFLLELDGSPLAGTTTTPPATPVDLTVSDSAGEGLLLAWNDAPGTLSYRIFRGLTNDFASAEEIGTSTPRQYRDTAAPEADAFYYWVTGVNDEGESAPGEGVRYSAAGEPVQPDLLIGPTPVKLTGDNVYDRTQQHLQTLRPRRGGMTVLLLENDGAPDALVLRGTSGNRDFQFRYLQQGGGNVTSGITAGIFTVENSGEKGTRFLIRTRHLGSATRFTSRISTSAGSDPFRRDEVKLRVHVR